MRRHEVVGLAGVGAGGAAAEEGARGVVPAGFGHVGGVVGVAAEAGEEAGAEAVEEVGDGGEEEDGSCGGSV